VRIRKIIVPLDFSDCSRTAFEYALRLAQDFGATVEVLHVIAPPPFLPLDMALWGNMQEDYNTRVEAEMDMLVRRLTAHAPIAVTSRIETGVPHDVIALASEEADLIVMGTHGRTGLPHLLLGSVAERTLRASRCPVLTVPAPRTA
jgi:nucleotide-binding universal stress UspA family protein